MSPWVLFLASIALLHQIGMWSCSQPLASMCVLNLSPSLSKILAPKGHSLGGPYFSYVRKSKSRSSSRQMGLVRDLGCQSLWNLAVAETDTDLERGFERALSWLIVLFDECPLFNGPEMRSQLIASSSAWSPSPSQSAWSSFLAPLISEDCLRSSDFTLFGLWPGVLPF